MNKTDFERYCETLNPLWNTHISRTYAEQFFNAGKATKCELTDEEIMKIHGEVLERPHFQQVYLDPLKFARAILKKTSKK